MAASGIVVLLGILYLWVLPRRSPATSNAAVVMQPPGPAGSSQAVHPLAKHLEVGGFRVTQGAGQTAKIQFVVINHSGADLPELKMELALRPTSSSQPLFEFPVNLPSIGPYESRELSSTVKTNLKPYEWPDWQVLRADFRITSEP
jgi:hypothetical protein